MIRATTTAKIAAFRADYQGQEICSYKFHNLRAGKYPCWTTLKKYGVVKYVRSEFIDLYVDEGIEMEIRYYIVTD